MPDAFWDLPGVREALVERDFGRVLRAYRSAGGVEFTQARVARWLGLTQAQVSRLEQGARSATDLSKLDRWAQLLRIPQRCLWFALSQPPEEYSRPQLAPNLPATTGQPKEAERFARRSLDMIEGYDRGKLFNMALLASTLADQRRIEEACAAGAQAVQMTGTVRSVRTLAYLTNLGRKLAPFRQHVAVRDLLRDLKQVGAHVPDM